MSDFAIRTLDLGKRYRIGEQERYHTLRDLLAGAAWGLLRRGLHKNHPNDHRRDKTPNHIWALKDVSFEIRKGEVVGLVGRNGAGKTTLLKILSRVTHPTQGFAEVHGRLGSLLEVGTGFHPELTGRENIYLNGAVLGMKKREIQNRFDEIVSFAEVEKFVDTPVKRYSSGMYLRLAFAVAAHLEPEILLVDEVLAVGDVGFQKRCLGKMKEVAGQGRTILLVSHNMGVVSSLCPRSIVLDGGHITAMGETTTAIQSYLNQNATAETETDLRDHPNRLPGMKPALLSARLLGPDGQTCSTYNSNDEWNLEVGYINESGQSFIGIGFIIHTALGVRVGGFNTCMAQCPPYQIPRKGVVVFSVPELNICPGQYTVTLSVGSNQQGVLYDKVEHALRFEVQKSDIYGTGWMLTPEDGVHVMHANCRVVEID